MSKIPEKGITKKFEVVITKQVEITITPKLLGTSTIEEYLEDFRGALWHVDNMDDVLKYAADMAATGGKGYQHDGLGLLDSAYANPDVIMDVDEIDVDIHEI